MNVKMGKERLEDMEIRSFNLIIPKEPYSPSDILKENPEKFTEEFRNLISSRIGSLCAIQYLKHSDGISKAKIDFARLDNMYYDLRTNHTKSILLSFESNDVKELGLADYNTYTNKTAVRIVDCFDNVLYNDPEAEKKWWEEFEKLKTIAVPAEKAGLLGNHELREKSLIEYNILKYLFFKANFRIPERWPF